MADNHRASDTKVMLFHKYLKLNGCPTSTYYCFNWARWGRLFTCRRLATGALVICENPSAGYLLSSGTMVPKVPAVQHNDDDQGWRR